MTITTTNDTTRDGKRFDLTYVHVDGQLIGFVRKGKRRPQEGFVMTDNGSTPVYNDHGSKQDAIDAVVQSWNRRKHGVELGEMMAASAGF